MLQYRGARRGNRRSLISQYANSLGHAITRHRAEVALRAANVESEMASRARAAFVANMSHELRTPLNAIIGFSDVLRDSDNETLERGQVVEFTNYIHASAVSLLDMINRLLELTKIHSGSITLNPEEVDLAEIVAACVAHLGERAAAARVEVASLMDDRAGLAYVDPTRTRQIFFNLIDNAIKFSREGGRVTVSVERGPSGRIVVTIADEGIGMSEGDIETVLSRFGQVESGLDRRYDGTGAGLPIARALTELQGGVLTISSRPHQGTEVRVVLPVADRTPIVARGTSTGARA
jgi:signal transduction histidine kinase